MPVTLQQARATAECRIREYEESMNSFGSGCPDFEDRKKVHVVIVDLETREEDFGWIFFYQTQERLDGDITAALAGNGPLIVDRNDGSLHETGTAQSVDWYIADYRKKRAGANQRV